MTARRPPDDNRHDNVGGMSGRSGQGTPRQTVRVPEALWDQFGELAGEQERSRVIREFIAWYVGQGEMPERPAPEEGPGA